MRKVIATLIAVMLIASLAFATMAETDVEMTTVDYAEGAVLVDNDYVTVTLTGNATFNKEYKNLHIDVTILNKTEQNVNFQLTDLEHTATVNDVEVTTPGAVATKPQEEIAGDMSFKINDDTGVSAVEDVKSIVIYPRLYDGDSLDWIDCDIAPIQINFG